MGDNNKSFFKNAKEGQMSLGDIFSEVTRKHTKEEADRVFIAGTELTTPKERDMLAGWQKPFLFARFFGLFFLGLAALYLLMNSFQFARAGYIFMLGTSCIVPVTILILIWEMNIPRDISLTEVFQIMAIGGVLSIFAAIIGFTGTEVGQMPALWAGLVEEPAKLLIIYYFLKKKNRKYILDGILLGVAVGTGFAMFESMMYTMEYFGAYGLWAGIDEAFVRAFSGISGHGLWAGLYGGGLLMAKGSEEVEIRHIFSIDCLKYFGIAMLIHAVHNMGLNAGLPGFFWSEVFEDYLLETEWMIEAAVTIAIFLSLVKIGVNQIVTICMRENGGRVTMAVNRNASPIGANAAAKAMAGGYKQPAGSGYVQVSLEAVAGPAVGQSYSVAEGQSVTIGRNQGQNDIALPTCKNISGTHCQFSVSGSCVYVRDLNSTNGTFVGEQRIMPQQAMPVSDGQIIYLGNKNCGFRIRVR